MLLCCKIDSVYLSVRFRMGLLLVALCGQLFEFRMNSFSSWTISVLLFFLIDVEGFFEFLQYFPRICARVRFLFCRVL